MRYAIRWFKCKLKPPKKEVDRTPLPPDKMEKLFEQIKLKEGTSHWTEDQQK